MAKPIENTERIAVHLPKEQLEILSASAKGKGMTISGYVRLLIIEHNRQLLKTQIENVGSENELNLTQFVSMSSIDEEFAALEEA